MIINIYGGLLTWLHVLGKTVYQMQSNLSSKTTRVNQIQSNLSLKTTQVNQMQSNLSLKTTDVNQIQSNLSSKTTQRLSKNGLLIQVYSI